MPKVKDIAEYIESLAPKTLAEPWDNVGQWSVIWTVMLRAYT